MKEKIVHHSHSDSVPPSERQEFLFVSAVALDDGSTAEKLIDPNEDLRKYKPEDFEVKSLLKAGVPLDYTRIPLSYENAEASVLSAIEKVENELNSKN